MTLEDLGYNQYFEEKRAQLGDGNFLVARVIAEHKEAYTVKDEKGEYLAKITGKQMFEAQSREDYPVVGDWVAIIKPDNEHAVIKSILPRLTTIKRNHGDKSRINSLQDTQFIAANVDVAFVVQSVGGRDYSLNRFERYFALALAGGVQPAIILNKIDLITKEDLDLKLAELKNRFPETDIILVSATTGQGLAELRAHIKQGKTYCFLGSSGVGKSSLINKLLGEDIIKTEEVGLGTNRGKHATTSRDMYFLPASPIGGTDGGMVIDNPGMREVGIATSEEGLGDVFDEIVELAKQCKYSDCTHTCEAGCAVLEAVASGQLDKGKYDNYISLKKEAAYYEMDSLDKREKDRQFGKFLKNAKEDIKKYKGWPD